jgi:hypothetical protein
MLVYLAAGLSVRIVNEESQNHRWTALGAILGLGYLTKTAMLPMGAAVIATVAFAASQRKHVVRGTIMAAGVFLVVCLPQVIYVSFLKGAPTIGDVGRLAHAWYTARVPPPLANIGTGLLPAFLPSPDGPQQELRALDAVRDKHPMVYEVNGPFPGTLPIWYDATYWYRHVRVPLALKETLIGAARHIFEYLRQFSLFILAGSIALITARRSRVEKSSSPTTRVLVLPALLALAMYALSYSEPRYIAPFAVLLLSGVVLPSAADQRSTHMRLGLTAIALLLFAYTVAETLSLFKEREPHERAHRERLAVVEKLRGLGLKAGSRIGYVGDPYTAYWAQLAGLRFVSVIPAPEARAFWEADSVTRASALRQMRDHGGSAILAHGPERSEPPDGWIRVASDGSLLLYSPGLSAARHNSVRSVLGGR